jgi:hypothetical protein
MMKIPLAVMTVAVATLHAVTARADLDFSSLPTSQIQFGPGSEFSITGGVSDSALLPVNSLAQFQITSSGAAMGLEGAFGGGPWAFGPITVNGIVQTANVTTTTGKFAIDDGTGTLLTGNVDWVQVFTIGATGGLNAGATVNITGMSYAGSNAALLALLQNAGTGTMDLSFQFASSESLTQLADGATIGTSYSGSLTAVPEPATIIAGVLLLLPLGMSTLRILRRGCAIS